jgi:hypothetical protein
MKKTILIKGSSNNGVMTYDLHIPFECKYIKCHQLGVLVNLDDPVGVIYSMSLNNVEFGIFQIENRAEANTSTGPATPVYQYTTLCYPKCKIDVGSIRSGQITFRIHNGSNDVSTAFSDTGHNSIFLLIEFMSE